MSSIFKSKPSLTLTAANVFASIVGLFHAFLYARFLGASNLAAIGVILSTTQMVFNFLDIKVLDLAAKVYPSLQQGRDHTSATNAQYNLILACALFNALLGIVATVASFVLISSVTGLFVEIEIKSWWIVVMTVPLAFAQGAGALSMLYRFTDAYGLLAWHRIISALSILFIFVPILLYSPNLNGYFLGALGTSAANCIVLEIILFLVWKSRQNVRVSWAELKAGVSSLLTQRRDIIGTNAMGYVKMLHRTVDVLVVAYFSSDAVTGVYRFARSMTDRLYIVYEAVNQVEFPRFIRMAEKASPNEYFYRARSLFLRFLIGTIAVIGAQIVAVPFIEETVLAGRFNGLTLPIVIMTLAFAFSVSNIPGYPYILVRNGLNTMSFLLLISALMQHGLFILLLHTSIPPSVGAAIGYLVYEIALTFWMARFILKSGDHHAKLPI